MRNLIGEVVKVFAVAGKVDAFARKVDLSIYTKKCTSLVAYLNSSQCRNGPLCGHSCFRSSVRAIFPGCLVGYGIDKLTASWDVAVNLSMGCEVSATFCQYKFASIRITILDFAASCNWSGGSLFSATTSIQVAHERTDPYSPRSREVNHISCYRFTDQHNLQYTPYYK